MTKHNRLFLLCILILLTTVNYNAKSQGTIDNLDEHIQIDTLGEDIYVKIDKRFKNSKLLSVSRKSRELRIVNATAKSITISIQTEKNVLIDIQYPYEVFVKVLLKAAGDLRLKGDANSIVFINNTKASEKFSVHVKTVEIDGANVDVANFRNASLKNLIVRRNKIHFLNLKDAVIEKVFLLQHVSLDSANFFNSRLPSTITLDSVEVKTGGLIDMSNLRVNTMPDSTLLERTMTIRATDLDKFKLSYDRWSFHLDSSQKFEMKQWIYEKIIKNNADQGCTHNHDYYQNLLRIIEDKERRGPTRNWINEAFWENGKNKKRAIKLAFVAFGMWYLFNLIFYKCVKVIYMPVKLGEYHNKISLKYPNKCSSKYLLRKAWKMLLFTSYLFWGFKLDLHSMSIKFPFVFAMLIVQYLMGLICVAYIISFIIVK